MCAPVSDRFHSRWTLWSQKCVCLGLDSVVACNRKALMEAVC